MELAWSVGTFLQSALSVPAAMCGQAMSYL